ncbi:hypothetical protein RXV94_02465 [Yeosuana sp. MJ-SS3]|jgi:hypothetical protein|uniref:Uncharacterized protein n=1 Tax=Gilvirhabdus luticola TaxID=3079858 RepID=A0ABU3U3N6_9FLAO|nr:hypothetical protein [Yeosuana sp. MJ-SS3]MDU8885008.1 hypothetical protein [Yeosuana sp. MJ-SS3]
MKKSETEKERQISRRGFLPFLGGSLLIPLLGFGNPVNEVIENKEDNVDDEYQTLLKPDGTAVKVKTSVIKKSKVVKKNISNKSLLNWLSKKL